jgi:hypothetical protein
MRYSINLGIGSAMHSIRTYLAVPKVYSKKRSVQSLS